MLLRPRRSPSEIICNNTKLKNNLEWNDSFSDIDCIIKSSIKSRAEKDTYYGWTGFIGSIHLINFQKNGYNNR